MDFAELLLRCHELLLERPDLLEHYSAASGICWWTSSKTPTAFNTLGCGCWPARLGAPPTSATAPYGRWATRTRPSTAGATRHADVAFERVVNTPPRGIGGKTVEIIRGLARARGVSMWQACKEGVAEGVFSSRAKAAVADFLRLVDDIADAVCEQGLREIAGHCVEASGLAEFHGKEGGERGIARQENLRELVHACAQFGREITLPNDAGEDDGAASELGEFLDQAALESGDYQSAGPACR